MAKFKAGDKVRVIKGHEEGASGVVTNPYWQIAANDWPFVLFTDDEGNRHSADDSNMVLVEDPTCEYSVQYTIKGRKLPPTQWMSRDAAEEWLNNGGTYGFDGAYGPWEKKLVKRRKAGEVENV